MRPGEEGRSKVGGERQEVEKLKGDRITETHKDSINIISIQLAHETMNINDSIITAWTLALEANPHAAKL